MLATSADGPTVSLSFANNFWGKDDAGVAPLLDRMHHAKISGDELKAFYTARAELEAEYAKKLLSLAKKPLGSCEAGTLKMSLDVARSEVESMGKQHQHVAQQMKTELEEPLASFAGGIKERRKIVQTNIEKLLKMKMQQTTSVNKTRDKFEQDCLKIKGYLAQGHMVMGQEERKNKAKLEKTQVQMSQNSSEYEAAVKLLEEITARWNREWKAACDKFQDLEEERIDYFKSSLWQFANIASTVCVSDDQSCEKIRLSLEDCEVEKDITGFIQDKGTGQEIPDPPKYINFCRGDIDENGSQSDSDNGDYSVAQFPRSVNPAFRTSSPQPSTYESHHDPDSSLREDMGIPKSRNSLQSDEQFVNLRSSQGSGQAPPSFRRSQSSTNVPPPTAPQTQSVVATDSQDPYANVPQIPHNPYPADGMTQFCRPDMKPPSERSSIPSPMRPGSRDSHSDQYSNPSSFTSIEPDSARHSPTKGYNDSAVSGMSSGPEEMQPTIQKKKSGFFNSPFRRRSNKRKEDAQQLNTRPAAAPAPAARNHWTPANAGRQAASAGSSPIKPLAQHGRSNTWGQAKNQPELEGGSAGTPGYQLGIGDNVFDVAAPDRRNKPHPSRPAFDDSDPIAQALADLKSINSKQAGSRQSADRHYGMATPAPPKSPGPGFDTQSMPARAVPTPFAMSAQNTPPPGYEPPISRLGAPQPAHTRKEMQRTTEQYVTQKRDMFSSAVGRQQQHARTGSRQDPPRATSPVLPRAVSPRPFASGASSEQQPHRAPSPNPYGSQQRPRAQSSSPIKQQPNYGGYQSRGGSPCYQVPRAVSPNPAYNRSQPSSNQGIRPPSSRGSDHAGGGAVVLAPPGNQDHYNGPQQGGRPQSQYYGANGGNSNQQMAVRTRSQSQGAQRQYTKDGRPILHYSRAMYMYQAAIPEELSFAKGDILAVLRLQDDGWWEAEVVGKPSRPGLVPSNYLKNC